MQRNKVITKTIFIQNTNIQRINLRTRKRKEKTNVKKNLLVYLCIRNTWEKIIINSQNKVIIILISVHFFNLRELYSYIIVATTKLTQTLTQP